ncbi:MAG: queuosine precursor transporter [Bacteroidales bacterium]
MKQKVSIPFMLLGILFCVCLITSNLLETKVIQVFGLTLTAGFLVFPISYILNDCIVEVWGFKKASLVIWCGFAMNFLVMAFTGIAVALPSAPFWEGAEHFNYIFGLAPRIVVASLCAFLVGSFLNAYVMSKMKVKQAGKSFSVRAIASTIVGETSDSIFFFPIAFGGLVTWKELLIMAVTQVILKSMYEVIVLPLTVTVVRKIKNYEGVDVYDTNVSYNIFKFTKSSKNESLS